MLSYEMFALQSYSYFCKGHNVLLFFFIVKRCYMFAIFYIKRYFCGTMTNNLFEFI